MIRIAAIIVLYNPEMNRLHENIMAVYDQVDEVHLIDNTSNNIASIKEKYKNNKKISFQCNNTNCGIAKALNQGFEYFFGIDMKME